MKRSGLLITAAVLTLALTSPCLAATGEAPLFHSPVMAGEGINADDYAAYKWRNDIKNTDDLPFNFRTMQSEFGKPDAKYGLDESYEVDCTGLDTLRMSGSGEYNEKQFYSMVEELEKVTDRENIYVIDLRQESHFYAEGYSVCWWGERDWSNLGKSTEEIETEEAGLASDHIGDTITIVPQDDTADGSGSEDITITYAMTERELVESAGLHYERFPCTDHIWPDAEQIDAFIAFVKTLPEDAWLHFHCVAGMGRTGALMCIYDIMCNPDVSLKDIAYRQHLLGANYLLTTGTSSWTGPYKAEVTLMLTTFYVYAQECGPDGYQVSWSEWLQNR